MLKLDKRVKVEEVEIRDKYKDGKNYIYEGMENDNTFIYKVYVRELKEV